MLSRLLWMLSLLLSMKKHNLRKQLKKELNQSLGWRRYLEYCSEREKNNKRIRRKLDQDLERLLFELSSPIKSKTLTNIDSGPFDERNWVWISNKNDLQTKKKMKRKTDV